MQLRPDFNNSIGYAIPSTWISIRDDDGDELGIIAVGEICVKGAAGEY